uniref:Transposase n=1 Tax=Macrostomum lignano TaxID=282301 RepID=A0A1I8FI60_9PLAT
MPTESERHEVGQQAALHLERMIALRNSGRATQLEHLELEGPSALGGHFPHSDWFRSTDAVVQMFSNQAVKLRKLARLMQCAVELKRSALLRKRRGSAGWVKFAKIFIQGATIKSIMSVPDHANLLIGNQRTGRDPTEIRSSPIAPEVRAEAISRRICRTGP